MPGDGCAIKGSLGAKWEARYSIQGKGGEEVALKKGDSRPGEKKYRGILRGEN